MFRLVFVFALLRSECSFALEPGATLGFALGGDQAEKGTSIPTQKLEAGTGFFLSTHLAFDVSDTHPHGFQTQVGIGYLFNEESDDEEKNKVSWSRWPLDVIYYYKNDRNHFRLGYGATYHIFNKLKGRDIYSPVTTAVDNSLGWVVVVEKYFKQGDQSLISLGLRYTRIDYVLQRFNKEINGDSLMITMTFAKSPAKTPH